MHKKINSKVGQLLFCLLASSDLALSTAVVMSDSTNEPANCFTGSTAKVSVQVELKMGRYEGRCLLLAVRMSSRFELTTTATGCGSSSVGSGDGSLVT